MVSRPRDEFVVPTVPALLIRAVKLYPGETITITHVAPDDLAVELQTKEGSSRVMVNAQMFASVERAAEYLRAELDRLRMEAK